MVKGWAAAAVVVATLAPLSAAEAGIQIGPYASIKSTKSVSPDKKNKGKENEKIKQRQEYGVRGSIGFFSLLKAQASVGQASA